MISYAPLWETMERLHASTYTLQVKGKVSSSSIRRIKAGDSISTNTIDAICKILNCSVDNVIEYQSSFCLWARRGAAGAAFGRVWDPPLQKTKPFRVCRRGRTLAGPPGNGRRLGRAAQCAAPTKKRERSEISVGAGPRPARGRPHGAAPTGSPSPKGRLSGDRKGRPYVFPKTAGGSGTRPYKRQNRFGYAVGAGYWPARPGMGDG